MARALMLIRLDDMIYAFEQACAENPDAEDNERVQRGLKLFAENYFHLWT